jgi:hypothetical protein
VTHPPIAGRRALLKEAAALYAEIGMPKHRELAAAMLAAVERR